MQTYHSQNLNDTKAIGETLFKQLELPVCVYLVGGMGVGKTSLCQAIIQAAGYAEAVTSPTYNLIQEYTVDSCTIYHMDLYRLQDPAEIEYLGLDDLWHSKSLFLIEWPSNGEGFLRNADFTISISQEGGNERYSAASDSRLITFENSKKIA